MLYGMECHLIVIGGRISTGNYKDKDGFMEAPDGEIRFD